MQSNFPEIGLEHANGTLTGLGILVAAFCLASFTVINVTGVRWLAESDRITMVLKLAVPTLTIIVLVIVRFTPGTSAPAAALPLRREEHFRGAPARVVFSAGLRATDPGRR